MKKKYGQDRYSPYAAMGNQPESMIDPNGLAYEVFERAHLTAPDLPIESTNSLEQIALMSRFNNIEDIEEISDFFNTSLSLGDTENLINSYYSEQQQEAITSSIVESVIESFASIGVSMVEPNDGGQNGRTLPITGQAKVYIETNDIGHVYIEVNGTVFSYGRYDGSYTPQSGRFGPVGNGILYKYEGEEAETFIKQRMEESPTNVYSVDINISGSYNFLNDIYNQGTVRVDENGRVKSGRHVDTYFLIGNNCTTITSEALRHGGLPIGNYQTPASMNKFFYDSNAIKNGYNPGLWGPKR